MNYFEDLLLDRVERKYSLFALAEKNRDWSPLAQMMQFSSVIALKIHSRSPTLRAPRCSCPTVSARKSGYPACGRNWGSLSRRSKRTRARAAARVMTAVAQPSLSEIVSSTENFKNSFASQDENWKIYTQCRSDKSDILILRMRNRQESIKIFANV